MIESCGFPLLSEVLNRVIVLATNGYFLAIRLILNLFPLQLKKHTVIFFDD